MKIRHRRLAPARAVLTVAVLGAAFLAAPSRPAQAMADPLTRCRENQRTDWHQETDVLGNGGGSLPSGTNPANVLLPGDAFVVRPLLGDRVRFGLFGPNHGPDGNLTAAPGGWPFAGLHQYSEILRFNNNPAGWVRAPAQATAFQGCQVWTEALPVRLLFYVNDPQTWDNGGQWATSLSIWRA
ncbi:hypothetical protein [Sphaerisporangium dianthi]|uniref:Secreted protein n=1 Tax=Sphaerisporangium dianthi TaxID=1436120 RepID=A0ABV9CE37_9ACTN